MMQKVKVKIKKIGKETKSNPEYATLGSSGCDLCSAIPTWVEPQSWTLVPTGISIELPDGYEAQVRSRSGLALKKGVSVLNSPGTIDNDYAGEIKVILVNHSQCTHYVKQFEKIAQLVICPVVQAEFEDVVELTETDRGAGGFGSTGS